MSALRDLTGLIFGRLTVIERAENSKQETARWRCVCTCGKEKISRSEDLVRGNTRSCGCIKRKDITGETFGRLTVIRRAKNDNRRKTAWICLCACGNQVTIRAHDLITGKTKSCGCFRTGETSANYNPALTDEERIIKRKYPEYNEWRKEVYKRDNYTCQVCGQINGKLNAHHIESYNSNLEIRTKLSNGITICDKCHKNFHHQYGRGNNTKKQFEEFTKIWRES